MTRRQLLQFSLFNSALWGNTPITTVLSQPTLQRSRIIIARDDSIRLPNKSLHTDKLLELLNKGMCTFFNNDNSLEIWKKLFKPEDVVGLKVNCLAGPGASTTKALVEIIAEQLQSIGIPKGNIIIWDRYNLDLERIGYSLNTSSRKVRCFGNDSSGFEDDVTVINSVGSLFSRTLTQMCTAVINIPVLKDHGITGLTCSLKNFFGAINNPNKYHLTHGNPYIADLNLFPAIQKKQRLIICDALTTQYEGGPSYLPQWRWYFNGLLIGTDPVALDTIGWSIIEEQRKAKELKSLKDSDREPLYILTAGDSHHRIGINNPAQIDVKYI